MCKNDQKSRTAAPTVQPKQHSRVSCPLIGPWCDGAPSALQEEKGHFPAALTTWEADMSLTLAERTPNLAFPPFLPENPTTFRTLVGDIGCTFSQPLESQQLSKTSFNPFSELLCSTSSLLSQALTVASAAMGASSMPGLQTVQSQCLQYW